MTTATPMTITRPALAESLDDLCHTHEAWTSLQETHPAWYFAYEDICPWEATKAELVELAQTAPNAFARGVAYAWLAARTDVAVHTGIAFL